MIDQEVLGLAGTGLGAVTATCLSGLVCKLIRERNALQAKLVAVLAERRTATQDTVAMSTRMDNVTHVDLATDVVTVSGEPANLRVPTSDEMREWTRLSAFGRNGITGFVRR